MHNGTITKINRIIKNAVEIVNNEDQKMEEDLGEQGVEITSRNYVYFTREKSLDYSDKEILEFAQWYYNNNK